MPDGLAKLATQSLYVMRPVLNGGEIAEWAKSQGFATTLDPDDMHVTIAFSRDAVDWEAVPESSAGVTLPAAKREVAKFEGGAVVLKLASSDLMDRWHEIMDKGASWDFPAYEPHITLTYDPGDLDLSKVKPFDGAILLGEEEFAPVEDDWNSDTVEKAVTPFAIVEKAYLDHLAKRGARHTTREYAQLQDIHDLACKLGAKCPGEDRDMVEAGGPLIGKRCEIAKVDNELGLVFGWAIVCKVNGEDYYDFQDDHIPEDTMLRESMDFMINHRVNKVMHAGEPVGVIAFGFPVTQDTAKAFGMPLNKTGFIIAAKTDPESFAKFQSGEFTGFSIGGARGIDEEVK